LLLLRGVLQLGISVHPLSRHLVHAWRTLGNELLLLLRVHHLLLHHELQ
jgi:hypothetical protein